MYKMIRLTFCFYFITKKTKPAETAGTKGISVTHILFHLLLCYVIYRVIKTVLVCIQILVSKKIMNLMTYICMNSNNEFTIIIDLFRVSIIFTYTLDFKFLRSNFSHNVTYTIMSLCISVA